MAIGNVSVSILPGVYACISLHQPWVLGDTLRTLTGRDVEEIHGAIISPLQIPVPLIDVAIYAFSWLRCILLETLAWLSFNENRFLHFVKVCSVQHPKT
jgi:hypothetical protein